MTSKVTLFCRYDKVLYHGGEQRFLLRRLGAVFVCALAFPLYAADFSTGTGDLSIGVSDLRLTQGADGGYHLYIRKKPGIRSIMLCETTSDPTMAEPTYAYRALEPNPVNGDEKRMLDGRFIADGKKNVYLMDSTVDYVQALSAEVFHIYIPYIIVYGYPEGRHGEVYAGSGTYLNIRAFANPYGDYSGGFKDNPFELQPVQNPLEGPAELNYMKDAEDALGALTRSSGGELRKSRVSTDLTAIIRDIVRKSKNDNIDLVIALDTTWSMSKDIEQLSKDLPAALSELMQDYSMLRVGFVFFRDYREQYLTRPVDFSNDVRKIQTTLKNVRAAGGGDIPEAIHEALYDAVTKLNWRGLDRHIVLITDAPPHIRPRGKITAQDALGAAKTKNIYINAILLPQ
ncbi:MAG: VWA domain-containing protein [Spirochaetaceae bacterium]|jgi:hypothetical protein|nr:VWA domain-containing protein [Spirochaetaceae bacterium]